MTGVVFILAESLNLKAGELELQFSQLGEAGRLLIEDLLEKNRRKVVPVLRNWTVSKDENLQWLASDLVVY